MSRATVLVVVEDKEEEQLKALTAIKAALRADTDEEIWTRIVPGSPQVGLKQAKTLVLFASDSLAAIGKLEILQSMAKATHGGVITDLMFPEKTGAREEPNGLGVIVACIDAGVPVVVCSDTNHHDVAYLKSVFPVLGRAHPKGEIPVILDAKDWPRAVSLLLALLNKSE